MKIREFLAALEQCAPLPLQDGFDNAGLQVGLTDAELTGALLCLDVTEEVIEEAAAQGCNLVVSHHPLLFKPIKSLTGKSYIERCVMLAVRHGIALYAAHTNLDNAQGGVNYKIAQLLGLTQVEILAPKENSLLKLVTFVPTAHADALRSALFAAGCGCIGNYDSCSYNLQGEGTFRAGEGSSPYCGAIGELHREPEVRIETILPAHRQRSVVAALMAAHPYEEPAYDLYPLANGWQQAGAGVVGNLPHPMTVVDFLHRVKERFHIACLRHNAAQRQSVRRVALCGGAGSFLLPNALAARADAFLTGEIGYHPFFGHERELLMVEMGHYESEQFTVELLHSLLAERCPAEKIIETKINTNPIHYL